MSQIPLRLRQVIAYTPENFLMHSGVSRLMNILLENIYQPEFCSFYLFGRERSGKSHFAIMLASVLMENGFYPKIFSGVGLKDALKETSASDLTYKDVFIIDDADKYFNLTTPGNSGGFVAFFEACRNSGAKIVMLSLLQSDCFNVDDHILSRLKTSQHFNIENPNDSEFSDVLSVLARQRGLSLSTRHVEFLHKRIGHSLSAMEDFLEKLAYLKSNSSEKISLEMISKLI
jgi:chromosomal replication initiation ATPase DnaA